MLHPGMTKIEKILSTYVVFPVLISFCSCNGNKTEVNTYYLDFENQSMYGGKEYLIQPFTQSDSSFYQMCDVYVSLRYSMNCKIISLPLDIEYFDCDKDTIFNKSLTLQLFDNKNNVKGKGNYGLYESSSLLLENQPVCSDFFISISTPSDISEGLISIGTVLSPKMNDDETNR